MTEVIEDDNKENIVTTAPSNNKKRDSFKNGHSFDKLNANANANENENNKNKNRKSRHYSSPEHDIEKNLKLLSQYSHIIENQTRYELEYWKLTEKLKEIENERNSSVEIIGNLEQEIEDITNEKQQTKEDNDRLLTELKIMEQKVRTLEQVYREDKQDSKNLQFKYDNVQMQVEQLQSVVRQKNLQLQEENEDINDEKLKQININGLELKLETPTEKQLYEEYLKEKEKNEEINNKMESLYKDISDFTKLRDENNKLKYNLDQLTEECENKIEELNVHYKPMEYEIISLASRNSQLEKEKEDLIHHLNEQEFENTVKNKTAEFTRLASVRGGDHGGDFFNDLKYYNYHNNNDDDEISKNHFKQRTISVDVLNFENAKDVFYDKNDDNKQKMNNMVQDYKTIENEVNILNEKNKKLAQEKEELNKILEQNQEELNEKNKYFQVARMESMRGVRLSLSGNDFNQTNFEYEKNELTDEINANNMMKDFENDSNQLNGENDENQQSFKKKQEEDNQKLKEMQNEISKLALQNDKLLNEKTTLNNQLIDNQNELTNKNKTLELIKEKTNIIKSPSVDKKMELMFEDEKREFSQKNKKLPDIPPVIREYLHLTASVVKLKYPKVQNIDSQELISKVANLPFYEYHNQMTQIMKIEEKKLKKKMEEELKKRNEQDGQDTKERKDSKDHKQDKNNMKATHPPNAHAHNPGFFSRFTTLFSGPQPTPATPKRPVRRPSMSGSMNIISPTTSSVSITAVPPRSTSKSTSSNPNKKKKVKITNDNLISQSKINAIPMELLADKEFETVTIQVSPIASLAANVPNQPEIKRFASEQKP